MKIRLGKRTILPSDFKPERIIYVGNAVYLVFSSNNFTLRNYYTNAHIIRSTLGNNMPVDDFKLRDNDFMVGC